MPPPRRPADFQEFWNRTRSELTPHRVTFRRAPGRAGRHPDLRLERLLFLSLGDAPIHAYLLRWAEGRRHPLEVHAHGYDSDGCRQRWDWAASGLHVLGVDLRGYGRSEPALASPSRWGKIFSGVDGARGHFVRGAVSDLFLAAIVGREVLRGQASRVVLHGSGFSAPLALMAEGLGQLADLLVLQPGAGAHPQIPIEASLVGEVSRYLESSPERRPQVRGLWSYFDPSLFAPLVRCPVLVGVPEGPAELLRAVTSRLGGPREIVPANAGFGSRWRGLAREGVPAGFGGSRS